MISAQCSECHSDVNSNKRGCGSPVKAQAQASARVDVPTARVFPAWTEESNTSASCCCECLDMCLSGNRPDLVSFNVNARMCAQSTTDRDLETSK